MPECFSIIAATVTGNRGAEAMLSTTVARLRERFPGARFNVFSYYPEEDRELLACEPDVRVFSSTPAYLVLALFPGAVLAAALRRLRLRRLSESAVPRSVRALGESTALVDLAGVSFIDGREKFLPFNVLTIWPAMLLGVPVVKLAQATGPFDGRMNRRAADRWLKRCEMVFARGDATAENLRELGMPDDRLGEASDVAFLHEPGESLGCENLVAAAEVREALEAERSAGRSIVGICPSTVIAAKAKRTHWDYPGFLAEIASRLTAEGHSVLLFPNATRARHMDKTRNNDLPLIARVTRSLDGTDHVHAVNFDLNTDGIKDLLACCDLAMVSRFHAMVACLSSKTPVLVLGWSHKYQEVMDQFGMGEYVFDHSERDVDALIAKLDELHRERTHLKRSMAQRLRKVRSSAEEQFEFLARMAGGRGETKRPA